MNSVAQSTERNQTLLNFRIWTHLGWRDVRSRYIETTLGPFWSTAALFSVVFGSSVAVSLLSGTKLFSNAESLAVGLTFWTLINNNLSEAPDLFIIERSLLLNTVINELVMTLRQLWKNYIFFLHNMLVVILFSLPFDVDKAIRILYLCVYGLFVSLLVAAPVTFLARIGVKVRDFKVLVPSVLQIVFFMSPVLWAVPETGLGKTLANYNPFAWVLEGATKVFFSQTFSTMNSIRVLILFFASMLVFEAYRRYAKSIRNYL